MSNRASLKKQFQFAIDDCFSSGADKHSYKRQNCEKIKIFSYETLRYYYKVSGQFAMYVKANYPQIKYIRDICNTHLQAYINSKKDIWSHITMMNNKSAFKVLEKMCNQYYHGAKDFNFFKGVEFHSSKKEKIRDEWMKRDELEKLIEYKKNKDCTSKALLGVEIAAAFGLRVSEVCSLKGKDINIEYSSLHVHEGKGKRSRNLPINTPAKKRLCEYIKCTFEDEERVCQLREDSVNQWLKRSFVEMNISKYKAAKTGIHAVRKLVATEEYNMLIENGKTSKEAEKQVSISLGHNKQRKDITNAYIGK